LLFLLHLFFPIPSACFPNSRQLELQRQALGIPFFSYNFSTYFSDYPIYTSLFSVFLHFFWGVLSAFMEK